MTQQSISILGAPTSGKTTFLAALSIALNRQRNDEQEQGWNVVGADTASRRQLVTLSMALAHKHTFPTATALAIERYHWLLVGPAWRSVKRRWIGSKRVKETIQIGLDLADASGELASPDQPSHGPRKDLIDSLVESRGVLFLFDPISEAKRGDAFYYIYSVLAEMAERMVSNQEFADGTLPHYVAVCISKFDDVKVLTTAEKLNMIIPDPDDEFGFPRIANEDAREFFLQLCRVLNVGDAELVLSTIERHFKKTRIQYFVTSAIGFYVNPKSGIYDPEDMQNLLEGTNPQDGRIRGNVYPINVVEPLMWLAGKLTGTETP